MNRQPGAWFDAAPLPADSGPMTNGATSGRARIAALFRDPQRMMADGLGGSGPRRLLALVTMPLWLTPDIYYRHLRPGKSRHARTALWLAAGLWLGTMTLASLPVAALLQTAISDLGNKLGYWDDLFTGPAATLLLTTLFCVLFIGLALFEWVQTWAACIIDTALGGRTISPPPFGYFVTRIAGELGWLAAFGSALFFAIRPLNTPVFRWLESGTILKTLVIASLMAAFLVASDRKIRTARTCAIEIYGSGRKATLYQLGGWVTMFAGFCLIIAHHRH